MERLTKRKLPAALLALLLALALTACAAPADYGGDPDNASARNASEGGVQADTDGTEGTAEEAAGSTETAQSGPDGTEPESSLPETEDAAGSVLEAPEGTLEVHFIDVGQGDCTLITCDGEAMLIDAGNNDKGTTVQAYLQGQGIEELEYVIGTHPDADHIGGMDVVLYKFDVLTVLFPDIDSDTATWRDVLDTMEERGYARTDAAAGDTYPLGSAEFTVISPAQDYTDTNDMSVVIRLTYGETAFLFTGDASTDVEADILESGANLPADVLKCGHHGSSTSTSEAFLSAASPTYAVISCGDGNSYGHPHEETLYGLYSAGIETYRTDDQGTVIAYSDGTGIWWSTAPADDWVSGSGVDVSDANYVPGSWSGSSSSGSSGGTESGADSTESDGEGTYVLNTSTMKFHLPDCSSVEKMSDSNREEYTGNRSDLIAEGYSPCGNCNP